MQSRRRVTQPSVNRWHVFFANSSQLQVYQNISVDPCLFQLNYQLNLMPSSASPRSMDSWRAHPMPRVLCMTSPQLLALWTRYTRLDWSKLSRLGTLGWKRYIPCIASGQNLQSLMLNSMLKPWLRIRSGGCPTVHGNSVMCHKLGLIRPHSFLASHFVKFFAASGQFIHVPKKCSQVDAKLG